MKEALFGLAFMLAFIPLTWIILDCTTDPGSDAGFSKSARLWWRAFKKVFR